MKTAILAIFIFWVIGAKAQVDTVQEYHVNVVVDLADSVCSGYTFKRKAIYDRMIYGNYSSNIVVLQFIVKFYNEKGEEVKVIPPYSKELFADKNRFVDKRTGTPIGNGSEADMLAAYGVKDGNGVYTTNERGKYFLTSKNVMCEYDFYNFVAQNVPAKIHDLIRTAAERASKEGRL